MFEGVQTYLILSYLHSFTDTLLWLRIYILYVFSGVILSGEGKFSLPVFGAIFTQELLSHVFVGQVSFLKSDGASCDRLGHAGDVTLALNVAE